MRTISKNVFAAMAGLSMLAAMPASATGVFEVDAGDGQYTFVGSPVRLTNGLTLTCELTLVGVVSGDGTNTLEIEVIDGSADGSLFSGCWTVDFDFPWTATITHANIGGPGDHPHSATDSTPVDVTFHNVSVDTPVGQCSGSVTVQFSNNGGGASYFDFDNAAIGSSGCSVDGTVSHDDVNVWHTGSH